MLLIKLPVSITTQRYVNQTIDMLYPYVYVQGNIMVQQRINLAIRQAMFKLANDLKRPDLVTYISGSYEIKMNERNILSILLVGLANFGGAHPMTMVRSLTFDVNTGKLYELYELFKPDCNYQDTINNLIEQQIEERNIQLLDGYPGIKPNQDYYVSDVCLVIYFQLYDITPYVAGFPYFPIPVYALESCIPENSILNRVEYFI